MTTRTASTSLRSGHGRRHATSADAPSPASSGRTGPMRSERRPSTMFCTASTAAEQRNVTPIATAPKPSAARRSGASTESVPKRSEGRTTSQQPASIRRSESAPRSAPGPCISPGGRPGVIAAHPTRPSERTPTVVKVTPIPASEATPPSTGPNSAPATAVANAVPIRLPRLPGGDADTSHAIAPVHENALATPWANRAASSCHGSLAIPKSTVHAATTVRPTITVTFGPARAVTMPLGIAPTSAPAGYEAASNPAPVFPSPSSSA